MRGKQIAIAITLVLGTIILIYGVYIGVMIGADWYGKDATFAWHMNNYIVMEAQYAYSIFGLATMALGGLTTGVAILAFLGFHKTKKIAIILLGAFFVAILTSGLGFNTLDFMLGCFYWTNQTYPPPVQVGFFSVDVWNFYFFFFVAPLWLGGFLIGSASAYFGLVHRPQYHAAASIAKKNLEGLLHPQHNKTYVAESKTYSVSRRLAKENFDATN
jgi:hypothetical protein